MCWLPTFYYCISAVSAFQKWIFSNFGMNLIWQMPESSGYLMVSFCHFDTTPMHRWTVGWIHMPTVPNTGSWQAVTTKQRCNKNVREVQLLVWNYIIYLFLLTWSWTFEGWSWFCMSEAWIQAWLSVAEMANCYLVEGHISLCRARNILICIV